MVTSKERVGLTPMSVPNMPHAREVCEFSKRPRHTPYRIGCPTTTHQFACSCRSIICFQTVSAEFLAIMRKARADDAAKPAGLSSGASVSECGPTEAEAEPYV